MRKIIYLTLIASVWAGMVLAGCKETTQEDTEIPDGGGNDSTEVIVPEITDEMITDYFGGTLEGSDSLFNGTLAIGTDAIDENRERIWNLWVQANNQYSEDPLPAPDDLLNSHQASHWTLPQELEPNAIMPFYYGFKGSAPTEGYPLFVYLHGSGSKYAEWSTGLALCQEFDDSPSLYFIPQIPNIGDYYRWWQKAKQFAWEKLLRLAFISGDINPDRIYFFGISEGGYGSQRLASFYADYLAGAGPMAGGEPLRNAPPENCANIAFSLRTGGEDTGFYRNTLSIAAKNYFNELEAAHPGYYVHNVEIIPGYGHSIDYYPTTPWLKEYERNPYPTYVAWENFEMDGIYRDGFYNIAVIERSNDDYSTRTFYEMTIDGNDITMNVNETTTTATETDPLYGIELEIEKSYTPSQKGRFLVYLCPELVNLDEEISLTVNGTEVFRGIVEPDIRHLVNSCATFFDPQRLYPAAIEVDLGELE